LRSEPKIRWVQQGRRKRSDGNQRLTGIKSQPAKEVRAMPARIKKRASVKRRVSVCRPWPCKPMTCSPAYPCKPWFVEHIELEPCGPIPEVFHDLAERILELTRMTLELQRTVKQIQQDVSRIKRRVR
jgi:hypothetical protein